MLMKQVSVFIENRIGKLLEITDVLKNGGIDIKAMTLADTAEFGILRMILSDPDAGLVVLKSQGFTVSLSNVLAVAVEDKPGGLHGVFQTLCDAEIPIDYCYAFLSTSKETGSVIMRVGKTEQAVLLLEQAGYTFCRV